jgi:hypothetical protein
VTAETCNGPCNSRYRRAMTDYQDALTAWQEAQASRLPGSPEPEKPEEPSIRPEAGAPVWCTRCQSLLLAKLGELDYLASIVTASADGHRTSTDLNEFVKGSKKHPSLSPTTEDVDELASVLRGWESVHRGEDPRVRQGDLATEITTTISWLMSHWTPMICNHDYGLDYGSEIRSWHRRFSVRGKTGTGKVSRRLPCPRCQRRSLVHEQGTDYVECTNVSCRRLLSIDEYDTLVEQRGKAAAVRGKTKTAAAA